MSLWLLLLVAGIYFFASFQLGKYFEKKSVNKDSFSRSALAYGLSMCVYCTAWSYYGSVGRAATSGIDFLAIYIGPTIMACLFFPILRKIVRISKIFHINSLADFISLRYGKSYSLGVIVSICCMIGVIPYIALQLKAIINSISLISFREQMNTIPQNDHLMLIAVGTTIALVLLSIFYGAKHLETREQHVGLMNVISVESIIKLVIFLIIGSYVTFYVFNGPTDIFRQIYDSHQYKDLLTLNDNYTSFGNWTSMILLSFLAIILLPRQFHVNVVENQEIKHLRQATLILPVYLFLINIFVAPIAFGGLLKFGATDLNPDNYVLAFPIAADNKFLTLLTWLGGLISASGMIILETIALSIMISNNLVMPLFFNYTRNNSERNEFDKRFVLLIRKAAIIFVLTLSLLYFITVGQKLSLVDIGLVSFCAVAQFAPSLLGGIFWKDGTKKGAVAGICVGFAFWTYILVLPNIIKFGWFNPSILENGPFGIHVLNPTQFFGLRELDNISAGFFWSVLFNTIIYFLISIYTKKSSEEVYQSNLFVDIYKYIGVHDNRIIWKGTAYVRDLKRLLSNFLGATRSENLINNYASRYHIPLDENMIADTRLVAFTERVLGGMVGTTSARILMQQSTKEETINIDEVVHILKENQQMVEINKELRKKSNELTKTTQLLKEANEQLNLLNEQRNEFLYTVTHELRTPLTSIRALSEIIYDNPDIPVEQQQMYLESIISESQRLTHLITQVLNLERFESGKQRLNITSVDLAELIYKATKTFEGTIKQKNLELKVDLMDSMMIIQCDKDLIYQVLINLIGNAIKFANHQIRIHTHFNNFEWQVWISDDGKGVPIDIQSLIFDKFFQAKNQTLKKPEGSGLGLAICKKIIESHNGNIWIENIESATGANFVFTLPEEHEQLQ